MERRNLFKDFLDMAKHDITVIFSIVVIVSLLTFAAFPQFLARETYKKEFLERRFTSPNWEYPLGTDFLGRDMVSLLIWGSRYALIEMVWPTFIAASIGVTLGLIAGYLGGTIDQIIMRWVDIMMSFPYFLLALAVLTVLGPGLTNAIWAVAIARISGYTRLARSLTLPMNEIGYVEYAKAVGASNTRIMRKYILPNILAPIIVQVTFSMPGTLSSVAGLSFLGLGGKPPVADWGVLLQQSRVYLRYAPWAVLVPGFAIFLVAFAFNTIGEELRDVIDPRRKYLTTI